MRAVFLIALFLASLLGAGPSQAQCGSCPERCSSRNPLGCLRRAVDPLCLKEKAKCEAREAARRHGGGAGQFIANAHQEAERVRREAEIAAQSAAAEAAQRRLEEIDDCLGDLASCPVNVAYRISGDDFRLVDACIADIENCPEHVIARLPAHALKDVISHYKDGLIGQAEGRWQTLPQWFIKEFEDRYPNIDLGQVQYATDIRTVHGQAVTFFYQIFFPQAIDLRKRSDMQWMLHELQHTQQYAQKGGEDAFLSEYFLHVPGEALARRTVDVHDHVSIEEDAIAKANELIDEYGWTIQFQNHCHHPVRAWLHYVDASGEWVTHRAFWHRNPKSQPAILLSDDAPVHTANRLMYFYAEIPGTGYAWQGDLPLEIVAPSKADPNRGERKTVKFREQDNTEESPEWLTFSVGCTNLPQQ